MVGIGGSIDLLFKSFAEFVRTDSNAKGIFGTSPGESKNYQEFAALENDKAKIADNKAIPIYNKYCKRYSVRVKVNQIKEADFKKWKYQSLTMRDECIEGKITVGEYIQWMEDYFPNRKAKQDK